MAKSIVAGRNVKTGAKVYYTGRAASNWTSDSRADAFIYGTENEASRKAREFNRYGQLHNITWWPECADESDGHAAGAAAMSQEMCGPF